MNEFKVRQIGVIRTDEDAPRVEIDAKYSPLFRGLEHHSHVIVLWWFSENDNEQARAVEMVHPNHNLELPLQGIFATRSPMRPNPIALTISRVVRLDAAHCAIYIDKTDAWDGSPVIDVKPYVPRLDCIEGAASPNWPKTGPVK